ncbi:MAG TPA: hypothetical protein PK791_05700 [Anaerolineaceae bacterium]|jgi:uncharacterized protein YbaR (Trm112 family)|nr:hypothetical protein [Anaerolineaceae bacterium]HOH92840.1 hypothetical protein [Anaerolineaceae bacterium]HPX65901.1 hypothetical protein [Anaerolineaceae bacterium]HQL92087.1 hypothetical protein [Anaerolineaceae bacterium]
MVKLQSLAYKGNDEVKMIQKELLDLLRCPVCAKEEKGTLEYFKDTWLICQDCARKYPIWDDIPIMLIDEGDKWQATDKEALPVPPPQAK